MTTFAYQLLNTSGKTVKGTIDAETREKAAALLKQNGSTLISIEEANALSKNMEIGIFAKKPKAREMAVFCRQFVSIINAGVSVTNCLNMLAAQTENKILASALNDLRMGIEKGSSLAESMSEHPDIFPDIFITLVKAGEISGSLDVSFDRMAVQFEKDAKLKATVKKASVYPTVVCVVAVVVVALLLAFVVPSFTSMLSDLGSELPLLTKIVVAASDFVIARWYIVLVVLAAIIMGIRFYRKSEGGKRTLSQLAIRLPLIGNLTVKTAAARMSRTLSTLLASGIPMIDAIGITAETMTNFTFRDALNDAKDDVSMGSPLSESLKRSQAFPPLVYHMVGIGEESGNIDNMLNKLADYYDEEVELATQALMSALEPMIIIVLALIIGAIVGAVMLPMMSMYSSLETL